MQRLKAAAGNLAFAFLLMAMGTAAAAPPGPHDPDWPCMSIKVPSMSLGAVWSGPPVDAYANTWWADSQVAALAGRLAQRRLPLDQAKTDIAGFAAAAGADKQTRLLTLVAALFDQMNQERSSVVAGLDRFGARQKDLASDIRTRVDKLHALQAAPDQDTTQIAALGNQLQWDTRLFEQRRLTTQYACAVPDLIEQRFFALARLIQQDLGDQTGSAG